MKKLILAAVAVIGCLAASAAEIPMKFSIIAKNTNTTISEDGVITINNKDGQAGGVNSQVNLNQQAPAKFILSGESLCEESLTQAKNSHDYSLYVDLTYMDNTKKYGCISTFSTTSREWQKKTVEFMPEKPIKQLRIYILYRNQTGKVQFKNLKLEEVK